MMLIHVEVLVSTSPHIGSTSVIDRIPSATQQAFHATHSTADLHSRPSTVKSHSYRLSHSSPTTLLGLIFRLLHRTVNGSRHGFHHVQLPTKSHVCDALTHLLTDRPLIAHLDDRSLEKCLLCLPPGLFAALSRFLILGLQL